MEAAVAAGAVEGVSQEFQLSRSSGVSFSGDGQDIWTSKFSISFD